MAETTADVRRDIELTRNRISDTLEQLENKLNVTQMVKDNPWPALALAVGAGVLLSGSRAISTGSEHCSLHSSPAASPPGSLSGGGRRSRRPRSHHMKRWRRSRRTRNG